MHVDFGKRNKSTKEISIMNATNKTEKHREPKERFKIAGDFAKCGPGCRRHPMGITSFAEAQSGTGSATVTPGKSDSIRPFRVNFPDADLADLRRRILATRGLNGTSSGRDARRAARGR